MVSRDRWNEIESLFDAALEIDRDERTAWLERAAVDPELRREVAQMLQAHERAAGILEHDISLVGTSRSTGPDLAVGSTEPEEVARAAAAESSQDVVPGMIGPYRVERELGRGGMGIVYLARDERLGRPVALKLLAGHLGNDAGARARFQAEARAASALDHPNICTIYDVGRSADGRDYLAMAYYDGETLAARLTRGRTTPDEIVRILLGVAHGLAAAHARGVVHRDIKPSNIMLGSGGETKILDFGVAKLESAADLTQPGVPVGTVAYMSPELARGEKAGAPADLWALGIVMYESLAGTRPFTGEHLPGVLRAIAESPLPPLTDPTIPGDLIALVSDLLRKDPDNRIDAPTLIARFHRLLGTDSTAGYGLAAVPPAIDIRGVGGTHGAALPSDLAAGPSVSRVGLLPRSLQLPETLTRFFGRERELEAARTILHAARLLTLTGPAGTGKTRLSLEIAQSMAADFPDGIFFVPLATITDPMLVPSAIARTLMPETILAADPLDSVRRFLEPRTALLILDNFEQVVSSAPNISQILLGCPGLKIIATSRVVLRISGEHAFAVPPLALVSAGDVEGPGDLEHAPATALFLDRARAADPLFQCDAANAHEIAAICERLDGIPLAIELAAARIRSFPPKELRARLDRRLDLLRGGGRDRPSRHQTLRQAIGWSYALLDPSRQRVFQWLSMFPGGVTLDTAEKLSLPELPDSTPVDVVEAIEDLFDHSLLRRDPSQARFSMLETIREFALDRLTEGGELARARADQTRLAIDLSEQADQALTGPRQKEWLDRCDAELDNLRYALDRAVQNDDPEPGLRIAGAIWRFWLARGHLREGRQRLEKLLELEGSHRVDPRVRARALHGLATLCHNQGRNLLARKILEGVLEIWRDLGDQRGIADTLNNLGWTACELTDLEPAQRLSEEALALGRQLGEDRTVAVALNNLGWVANYQSDHTTAIARQEENLLLRKRLGDQRGIAFALSNLAWAYENRGEWETAMRLASEAVEMLGVLEDDLLQALAKSVVGSIEHQRGNLAAAREALQASCEQWERVGNPSGCGWAETKLARLLLDMDEVDEAEAVLAKADASWQIVREQAGKGRWHLATAILRMVRQRPDEAADEARRSLEIRFGINDRQGLAESAECLAWIAVGRGTGDPGWLFAAAAAIRTAFALPAGWSAERIRKRVLDGLQESGTDLPMVPIETVTPDALREAARIV